MTRDLLDEIKTKWNIPVTLPMAVPWGKDDVVWLVGEVERLRAENERLSRTLEDVRVWAKDAGGEVRRLTAENERLRAEAKRADEEATKLTNSGIATTEQLVRALRAENAALRVENARLRRGKPEPDAFRRLRTCFEFDEDAPLEAVIKAVLQRFDGDLRLVAENARLREACTLALRVMEQTNKVNVPPMGRSITVTVEFAPEDVAVLRAALEKRP